MNSPNTRVEMGARRYRSIAEARRFGIGIRVEGGLREGLVARPEPGAADLVRIGFTRDRVGQSGYTAGMTRGRPSGEPGHREVEAAPKEMDGARLPQKAGAKELEDAIDLHKRAPEAMGSGGVIGRVGAVLRKADRVRHLVRHLVDDDRDADAVEKIDQPTMEIGNRLRLERKLPCVASAGARDEAVADEVELDLEDFVADRDRRGAEPACGNVERNLPAMVEPGRQRQPDLAHDLRPELQGCGCLAPAGIRQIGPNGGGVVHGALLL